MRKLLLVLAPVFIAGALESWASNYKLSGEVVEYNDGTALLMDSRGGFWGVLVNRELSKGTKITIYFHDNMTPNNFMDDIVKDISIIKEDK